MHVNEKQVKRVRVLMLAADICLMIQKHLIDRLQTEDPNEWFS